MHLSLYDDPYPSSISAVCRQWRHLSPQTSELSETSRCRCYDSSPSMQIHPNVVAQYTSRALTLDGDFDRIERKNVCEKLRYLSMIHVMHFSAMYKTREENENCRKES